ncbi:YraN family protein [Halarsenatibacter silvermanii]|uniref:UPF0102 protein SAMN04488692_11313 n=1 Tax=Halarsenatibacter silvermanii TaxID=321763 RepID=A0A1G9PGN3_9FIRM|nr:YraN family protein [Halarsenatibacter silvermanii]SDL97889.1 putative endonuclease [Halarsenatibacter silvermanii]
MHADHRRYLGEIGEKQAAEYLKEKGHFILATNFTTRLGEIDIVTKSGEDLVFVEVRTALSDKYGPPQYSITAAKKQRIRKVARLYMSRRAKDVSCRFDVITLTGDWNDFRINHIPGAF